MAMSRQSSTASNVTENILIITPSISANGIQEIKSSIRRIAELFIDDGFAVYTTILKDHENISTEKEFAEQHNIKLIGYKRPRGLAQNADPENAWLNFMPHCFYRGMPEILRDCAYIIAIGTENVWGAVNVKEAFYSNAKLILVAEDESHTDGLKDEFDQWADDVESIVCTSGGIDKVFRGFGKKIKTVVSPIDSLQLSTLGIRSRKMSTGYQESLDADMYEKVYLSKEVPKWHKEINETVNKFHESYARVPKKAIKEVMPKFESMMKYIEGKLREENMCTRLEYTGSAYEQTMINEKDIEFDLMILMSNGHDLVHEPMPEDPTRYFYLKPIDGEDEYDKLLASPTERVISPEKVVTYFISKLQKILNESSWDKISKLRKHGPAIQLDVKNAKTNEKEFSVDIVPAFQINSATENVPMLFVAKPYSKPDNTNAFRLSFSVKEKERYKKIDNDDGCRRKCARLLKALTNPSSTKARKGTKDTSLNKINSYKIKSAVFHVTEETKSMKWDNKKSGERLLMIMARMADFFEDGNFPNFFLPDNNLVADMKEDERMNVAKRLRRLCSSEQEFRKAMGEEFS